MPFKHFIVRICLSTLISFLATYIPMILVVYSQNLGLDAKVYVIITIGLVNFILLAFFIYLHYRLVIVPLKKITSATSKISSGNLDTRIKINPYDYDINALSINFNKMATEFENLEQMQKSFVSNASHELRSPLTSMQGFLQAILDGTISQSDQTKYLEIVLSETKRLSYMINSMLELSRMESGKYPISLTKFELNEVLRRIVLRFEPNLLKKSIQLDVDLVKGQCYVYADREKIEQVVINLIDNAIKYSPAGSRILVTTHIHQRKAYVSVKDKGYGISKKDQMLIWDRFYMGDKARTPAKEKGTGLGLSIVKKIIDDHKEVIWVESIKGQGATFIFTLTLFDASKHKVPPENQQLSRHTIINTN